jgi:hypothetical protein
MIFISQKLILIEMMSAVKGIAYLQLNRYNFINNLMEYDEKENTIQLSINPKSETENDIDHREHTRQLLYEILRERGIKFDSITGEKIDESSDIETLLRVIQLEKEKKKRHNEISSSSKPVELEVHKYNFVGEYWRFINELDKLWFSYLALNPFIVWLVALMYDE